MKALEYEQTQNLASPSMGTANSSAQATETVTSSAAAVGTINSTDAVLPQPPPEVAGPAAEAAYSPPAQEAAYSPPAQEAAPVPAEDVPYPPESQVLLLLHSSSLYVNGAVLILTLSVFFSILLWNKVLLMQ